MAKNYTVALHCGDDEMQIRAIGFSFAAKRWAQKVNVLTGCDARVTDEQGESRLYRIKAHRKVEFEATHIKPGGEEIPEPDTTE